MEVGDPGSDILHQLVFVTSKSSHPRAGLLDVPFGFINAGVRSLVKQLHLKSRGEVGGQYGTVFCGIYGCFRKYGYPQIIHFY